MQLNQKVYKMKHHTSSGGDHRIYIKICTKCSGGEPLIVCSLRSILDAKPPWRYLITTIIISLLRNVISLVRYTTPPDLFMYNSSPQHVITVVIPITHHFSCVMVTSSYIKLMRLPPTDFYSSSGTLERASATLLSVPFTWDMT